MSTLRRASVAGLLLAAAAVQAQTSVEVDEPRAFGHSVGDVVQRVVHLQLPDGYTLDATSLPVTGRRGQPLELRSVTASARSWRGEQTLWLDYQVFLAPTELRMLEMPPVPLRFKGPRGAEERVRVDAWPVTVAPLTPTDAWSRTGLGEVRPDVPPPLIDTAPLRWRLALYAGLLALAAVYLLGVYVGLPWRRRQRRPFGLAWRQLRRLRARPSPERRREAFTLLHAAINQSAGEAVFENSLARFLGAHPRFAPLREELVLFFRRSHDEFFAGRSDDDDDLRWLRRLARACRDAERGSA